ncbi:hypothetical protein HPT27_14600 [Permianibacter sp. IMCC34836]|uniref:hypothetical protein n=1 Tax=Permianibacter fluminis TaxID=2738515 RepID=UPI0015547D92|nr:hypothetical protein [Permianibacter fluminis]NQD38255.1 hypothetical protein [Permianibacter fluminis]
MNLGLDALIARGKALFDALPLKADWHDDAWEVTHWLQFRRIGAQHVWWHFSGSPASSRRQQPPLPQTFQDTAKALVLLHWHQNRSGATPLENYLGVIRTVFTVMVTRGSDSPAQLIPADLLEALAVRERRHPAASTLRNFDFLLRRLALSFDDHGITPIPLQYSGSTRRYSAAEPISENWPDMRRQASKLPDEAALRALAQCSASPLDDNERILLRILDLQLVLGTRIGETLALPVDCWVQEKTPAGQRCGIRYFPEKGFELAINWLAEQDVPIARRAVSELTKLCAPARAIAAWQERHPDRLWPFVSHAAVSLEELQPYIACPSHKSLRAFLSNRQIPVYGRRENGAPLSEIRYRAGDIEKSIGPQQYRLTILQDKRGKCQLRLSQSLCVKFEGQFAPTHTTVLRLLPKLVNVNDIDRALGNVKGGSIYDRRGLHLVDENGQRQPMRIFTHSLRHYRNMLYDKGGMTHLQQTLAMGRKSAEQTAVYQHPTPAESTQWLRQLQQLQYREKIPLVQQAIRNGKLQGPLTTAYQGLLHHSPVEAETFLQTFAGGVHLTPWGVCTHDFALSPCRHYLQCFDGCQHYHRTMSEEETARLQTLRDNMAAALVVMQQQADGEAAADRWISMLEQKLRNLGRILAMPKPRPDTTHAIPVFVTGGGTVSPADYKDASK